MSESAAMIYLPIYAKYMYSKVQCTSTPILLDMPIVGVSEVAVYL